MDDEIEVGSRWRRAEDGREATLLEIKDGFVAYHLDGNPVETVGLEDDFRNRYEPAAPDPREVPAHYAGAVEPMAAVRAWGLDFALGCVVKHVARAGRKGPRLDDLLKARAYLDDEIAAERAKGGAK